MILVYLLLAYGITNIVVFGSIFEWFRDALDTRITSFIHSIFTCPMCFSTWLGFLMSFTLLSLGQETPISSHFELPFWLTVFMDGCFTSGAVWLMFKVEDSLNQ